MSEPIRPKGMPRPEWNAMSAKQKAKVSKGGAKPQKKWYVSAQNEYIGNLEAGSGAAPRARNRRRDVDGVWGGEGGMSQPAPHPQPISINNPGQGRAQPIVQRELVALVGGSASLQSTSWQLQPGLAAVFVWLSAISRLYQKYRIRRLRLIYKPMVSNFDPLGSKGKCCVSFDTDALGSPLSSFIQAEGMTPNMRFMPYQDAELDITPSCGGERYVRSGPVPAGSDPKTYDAGTIYFSTDGFGGSGTIGELHVEYTVDLINPILPNSVPPVINLNRSKFQQLNLALPDNAWTKYSNLTVNSNALGFDTTGGTLTGVSGSFLFHMQVRFKPAAALVSIFSIRALLNGVTYLDSETILVTAQTSGDCTLRSTFVYSLNETDTIEIQAYTDIGATTMNSDMVTTIVAV